MSILDNEEQAKYKVSLTDSLSLLTRFFLAMIKVNLATEEYYVVRSRMGLIDNSNQFAKISDFLNALRSSGLVHPEDVETFARNSNLTALEDYFRSGGTNYTFSFRYHGKEDDEYHWASIGILKSNDYEIDKPMVLVYVLDIDNSFTDELLQHRNVEHMCAYDALTGLQNYYSYERDCKEYIANKSPHDIGVIFCDLNGLKLINDTLGHGEGNVYIQSFSDKLVQNFQGVYLYRLSGDEFLVRIDQISRQEFEDKAQKFYKLIQQDEIPVSSIGWAWGENVPAIIGLMKQAESNMYADKHEFYKAHPDYKRGALARPKTEPARILQVLMEAYRSISIVDLDEDLLYIMKGNADDKTEDLKGETKYTETTIRYCEHFVKEEYRNLRISVGDIDYLRMHLREGKSIICDYELLSGRWIRDTFRIFEKDKNKIYMVMYSQEIDKSRARRLQERRQSGLGGV